MQPGGTHPFFPHLSRLGRHGSRLGRGFKAWETPRRSQARREMESLLQVLGRTLRPDGRSLNTSQEKHPDQMPEPPRSAPFAPRISDSTLRSCPLKLIPTTVRGNEEPHSGRQYRRPCELAGSGQVAPQPLRTSHLPFSPAEVG